MLTDMTAPDGTVTGQLYLIEYNEDLWLAYDEEGRNFCKKVWLRNASVIPGCRFVTLRLIPDELFPIHGNEKPYIAWQVATDNKPAVSTRPPTFDQLKAAYVRWSKAEWGTDLTDGLLDMLGRYVGVI